MFDLYFLIVTLILTLSGISGFIEFFFHENSFDYRKHFRLVYLIISLFTCVYFLICFYLHLTLDIPIFGISLIF